MVSVFSFFNNYIDEKGMEVTHDLQMICKSVSVLYVVLVCLFVCLIHCDYKICIIQIFTEALQMMYWMFVPIKWNTTCYVLNH